MTTQLITGLENDAIPACYAPANDRLGKQCYPSMQCSQILLIKEPAEAQNERRGEGRDFSGSLT